MVLHTRIEYGFNGYQVPATPRAARSSRRRSAFKKNGEDNPISAFDLLASAAGKLLLQRGNSSTSSNNISANGDQCLVAQTTMKKERHNEDQTVKVENYDQSDAQKGFFVSELVQEAHQKQNCCKDSLSPRDKTHFGFASVITSFDSSDRSDLDGMAKGTSKNEIGTFTSDCDKSQYDETLHMNDWSDNAGKVSGDVVIKNEHPCLGPLGGSGKTTVCEDPVPQNSFPVTQAGSNLDSKDDDDDDGGDDESSTCLHINNAEKPFRLTPCIGDRRIRKILASKDWKDSSKRKDAAVSSYDVDSKTGCLGRKNNYRRLRSEKNYPIKKRRYFECYSLSNYDEGISSEAIDPKVNKGVSSSVADLRSTRDSHVKLRIKSFKVPELFIEIPETATIGSLKRTVLEAVTTILGGGLRVGVLVQGRKIRDDNKTLLQTGISQNSHSDSLGFCLEPNPSQTAQPLCPNNSDSLLPFKAPQSLTRYLTAPGNCNGLPKRANSIKSDHDCANRSTMEHSRALVPVPTVQAEALTVIPPSKSKRTEVAQRRIRRPFSVAEVEALVRAVEKLGTGRWRDVKLRAFDNAKHRTYVDLKDKWKTLVHTARISPQQRRGEPVPQELLDRVLTAHAYWSGGN